VSDAPANAVVIRPGASADLPELNQLYEYFVTHTPVTFDVTPAAPAEREHWFGQFPDRGPHRLLVAAQGSRIVGFACSKEFRAKEAYATSVETTVYLAPGAVGRGIGFRLYSGLFEALAGEDLHRAYAGITLPNEASIALHRKLDFREVGTYDEVGRKFDRYWSVQWFEKRLGETAAQRPNAGGSSLP
jgi:phosphinothricin acetyltransferase